MKKIECIGITTFNRINLLNRLISSINVETIKLIIINNGDEVLDENTIIHNPIIDKIQIINNGKNFGISYCRNLLLKNYLNNYLIMIDDDICLGENDLKNLYELTINNLNKPSFIVFGNSWLISLNKLFLNKNEFYDENFYPYGFEDSDYIIRAFKNKCNVLYMKDHTLIHGDEKDYFSLNKYDESKQKKINLICGLLLKYFNKKWGNVKDFHGEKILSNLLDNEDYYNNNISDINNHDINYCNINLNMRNIINKILDQ